MILEVFYSLNHSVILWFCPVFSALLLHMP